MSPWPLRAEPSSQQQPPASLGCSSPRGKTQVWGHGQGGVTAPAPLPPLPQSRSSCWSLLPQASPLLVLSCSPQRAPRKWAKPHKDSPRHLSGKMPMCCQQTYLCRRCHRRQGPDQGGLRMAMNGPGEGAGACAACLWALFQGVRCSSVRWAPAAAAPPSGLQCTGHTFAARSLLRALGSRSLQLHQDTRYLFL